MRFLSAIFARYLVILVAMSLLPACSNGAKLFYVESPTIQQNPNPRVPLAALLSFKTDRAVKAHVQIDDGERQWVIEFGEDADAASGLPILGMRPSRDHQLTIIVKDEAGVSAEPKVLSYRTPDLPSDSRLWPPIKVIESKPEKMEPGVTLLSVRRRVPERANWFSKAQIKFNTSFGLILGLDHEGEVVWYYDAGTRVAGIDRLTNGNVIFHNNDFRFVEIDMLGNKVGEYYAEERPYPKPDNPDAIPIKGVQTIHHQPHETIDGNYLSFAANQRVVENWYGSEYDPAQRKTQTIMGDIIIEFDRQGNVVWSWNTFDHLDVWRFGYEAFDPYWTTRGFPGTWDWTHGNGISHDPTDDSVIASFKLQDAIIKIDKASGEIKWIFGDPMGWSEKYQDKLLKPVGDVQWAYHMHNPRWTHKRTLLVFNNNKGQALPFDGKGIRPFEETFSNVLEYEIDEENLTVKQVWASETEITERSCVSPAMSEAHRLPKTDNILEINALCAKAGMKGITWDPWDMSKRHQSELPRGAKVREYTRESVPEIVWSLHFKDDDEVLQWEVFGGLRTPSLYYHHGLNH